MKITPTLNAKIFIILLFAVSFSVSAQVGINTTTPANGALLDISSNNKGFLMSRVALTGTNDVTTITPSATTGLLVYNTATAGALPIQVTPGFYYWNGTQWLRFYNRGYGIKFDQSAQVTANATTSTYTQITGLNTGNISIPYTGTYQVKVETAYAAGILADNRYEGVGQASISLTMSTNGGAPVRVKETYVTSTSKRYQTTPVTIINSIPQNTTIIYTVDLDVLNTYQFAVQGREWSRNNVSVGTFGKDTDGYSNSTGITNAQRGSISLILLKQL